MRAIKAFIKSHPVVSYFALVFAISWGGVLTVVGVGSSGFPATSKEQYETLFPIAILAMVAGPSVAGILLTGHLHGRAGLRELQSRLLRWRVGARWYAVALLTAPLVFTVVLLTLSLTSSEYLPGILTSDDKAAVLLMGIFAGLMAGIFEELGWTGFAVPTLLRLRYGVLGTGLIVGLPWAVWHFLVNVWASGVTSGELSLTIYLPAILFSILVGSLVPYRVLMVWVYNRTGGSLLVAMLMHVSYTASTLILLPLAIALVPFGLTYGLAITAALWVIVGAVAVANGGHLTRQPPPRRRVA
jgi:membrane protease YdiL (CAAX protease family)